MDRKNFKIWKRVIKYKKKLSVILNMLQEGVLIIENEPQSNKILFHN